MSFKAKLNLMRIFSLLSSLLLFLASSYSTSCFGADQTICFYNPETHINNFATLKDSFDSYLANKGNYQFQPFDNEENLKKSLKVKGNVFLLSGWSLEEFQQQNIPLKIAMLGTVGNNTQQQKALSARKEFTDFSSLKNTIIAGTGNETSVRSLLQQMNSAKYKEIAPTIKILIAPKDIDALMTINNGLANAAIAALSSLKTLEKANEKQYQQLHTLGLSKKSYFLVVATLGEPGKDEAKAIDILYNMTKEDSGQNNLHLLGLDGWIRK